MQIPSNKINELMALPTFLVDIFPKTVPQKADNRYFAVEEYFQCHRAKLHQKFTNILLKLYCYYDFVVSTQEQVIENLSVPQLLLFLNQCFEGEWHTRNNMNIILPECNALIRLSGDDLYLVLYNADECLKETIVALVQAEGLFFYEVSERK